MNHMIYLAIEFLLIDGSISPVSSAPVGMGQQIKVQEIYPMKATFGNSTNCGGKEE